MSEGGLRIGQAAALLGISVDTLRRWEDEGRVEFTRSAGGQRLVPLAAVQRLLAERRPASRVITASSARNQFDAIVTKVVRGDAAATVEMQAGAYRLVALTTAESIDELGLEAGTRVVASVKATSVVVGLPRE
ncbi:MAG: helix-turn-helix transcriptional regulator [Actinomycetota bacterium]|nr:helix-turn-helix transcriptional regulator [Actinomycetota bacterium]MDQ3528429.1 helix-turn-helix transcriptional regulator [Actinomycetota bacterium]